MLGCLLNDLQVVYFTNLIKKVGMVKVNISSLSLSRIQTIYRGVKIPFPLFSDFAIFNFVSKVVAILWNPPGMLYFDHPLLYI